MSTSRGKPPLCGSNLEAHGQNIRLRLGLIMLAVSLVMCVAIVQGGMHRGWRLAVSLPFFIAALGAYQGLYRTCPGLAAEGCREGCRDEPAPVADPETQASARRLARQVMRSALFTSLGATLVIMILP